MHAMEGYLTHTNPPCLVFAFAEDGTLSVFEDIAAAVREYEGIDVESGAVRFYDRAGVNLEPKFAVPNRRGKAFGLVPWVSSGVYTLVPSATSGVDSFALDLFETASLNQNPWFSSLPQLKIALHDEGLVVEFSASRL